MFILLIGAHGVGKNSLEVRFITGDFREEYDPTIRETMRKCIEVDHEIIYVETEISQIDYNYQLKGHNDYFIHQSSALAVVY